METSLARARTRVLERKYDKGPASSLAGSFFVDRQVNGEAPAIASRIKVVNRLPGGLNQRRATH